MGEWLSRVCIQMDGRMRGILVVTGRPPSDVGSRSSLPCATVKFMSQPSVDRNNVFLLTCCCLVTRINVVALIQRFSRCCDLLLKSFQRRCKCSEEKKILVLWNCKFILLFLVYCNPKVLAELLLAFRLYCMVKIEFIWIYHIQLNATYIIKWNDIWISINLSR